MDGSIDPRAAMQDLICGGKMAVAKSVNDAPKMLNTRLTIAHGDGGVRGRKTFEHDCLGPLSDGELSMRLADVVREVHRRIPDVQVRKTRRELDRAIQEPLSILARPAPRSPEQPTRFTAAGETSAILETKRNAVRAALLAGVKRGQVAKHFGMPLAAVRQIATKPAQGCFR